MATKTKKLETAIKDVRLEAEVKAAQHQLKTAEDNCRRHQEAYLAQLRHMVEAAAHWSEQSPTAYGPPCVLREGVSRLMYLTAQLDIERRTHLVVAGFVTTLEHLGGK